MPRSMGFANTLFISDCHEVQVTLRGVAQAIQTTEYSH